MNIFRAINSNIFRIQNNRQAIYENQCFAGREKNFKNKVLGCFLGLIVFLHFAYYLLFMLPSHLHLFICTGDTHWAHLIIIQEHNTTYVIIHFFLGILPRLGRSMLQCLCKLWRVKFLVLCTELFVEMVQTPCLEQKHKRNDTIGSMGVSIISCAIVYLLHL